jgi:hypothetical protein
MNDLITTHEINDTTRIAVYPDYHAESPLEYLGNDIGIFTMSMARGYTPLSVELDDINQRLANIQYNSSDFSGAIDKLFRRADMNYRVLHLQGYSQSEWLEAIIYGTVDDDVLASTGRILDKWFKGDIYTLSIEKLVTYANVDNTDDTHSHWQIQDSISGVYLDAYDSEAVVAEAECHFIFETN